MRTEIKPWFFFLTIAIAVACISFFIDQHRNSPISSNAELVSVLPDRHTAVFFADFALLRRSGYLKPLNAVAEEDGDYKKFVDETHFDYSQDIDALAGAAVRSEFLFTIRGRFDWPSLRRYAADHGGNCEESRCKMPATEPGRWIAFWPIQSDVMELVLGNAASPASKAYLNHVRHDQQISGAPVWVEFSPALLRRTPSLPIGVRLFTVALQSANSVVISLRTAPANSTDAFEIRLNASCASPAAAVSIANQLELETKLLKLKMAHDHEPADPASLAGLLISGQFHASGNEAIGVWPVSETLLRALE